MSLAAGRLWRSPENAGQDLKWVLVRRIFVVALLCMAGGGALVLRDIAQQATKQNEEAAQTVAKQLAWQLTRIDAALDLANRFPDWDVIVNYALFPGQCLLFVQNDRDTTHSSCFGTDKRAQIAPDWFVEVYASFPGPPQVEVPLLHKGQVKGIVIATWDAGTVADRAWTELSRLLGIGAAMIIAMCLLVYVVVERALRPTTEILSGLNRLAEGNLLHRLPHFRLRELNRIAEVFNSLAQKLEATTQERSELARRLVNAQEEERRSIARELHDDVAQRLSVVNSLATSIKKSCQATLPTVSRQSEELVSITSGTMRSLRETLITLRPPEIDDLGLVPSIQGLIGDHNKRANERTRFSLETRGDFDELPAEVAAHIYRIVQEGLNNAARHADARSVRVVLVNTVGEHKGDRHIELAIIDDGKATLPATRDRHSGIGLIGIRERVFALAGTFIAEQRTGGGFELRVTFPVRNDTLEAVE